MGGLGNVLFQLNYLYNLRDKGYPVKANITLLSDDFFTNKILRWSSHNTLEVLMQLKILDDIDLKVNGYMNIFMGALSKFIKRDSFSTRYCGIAAPVICDVNANHLLGYFHEKNPINERLVKKIYDRMTHLLNSDKFLNVRDALLTIEDRYVVHVRGGDYVRDPNFVISSEYYRVALSGQSRCYIVTNDKNLATQIFEDIEVEYEFFETRTPLEDFMVLALSKNKILANSTFSWWAAELGNSTGVIAQKDPFFDHLKSWQPDSKVSRRIFPI